MASPYGNSAVYRGAQRRANMIQNRDTANQQTNPLRDSILGTPLEDKEELQQAPPELPTTESGSQFTLKPYSDGGGSRLARPANGPSTDGSQPADLFNRGQGQGRFGQGGMQGNDGSLAGFMGRQKQFKGINSIEQGYRQLLGREADPEGLAAMQQNPGGLQGALRTLYESPEGQAYRQSQLRAKPQTHGAQGQQPQTPQYDSSNWDTDGWATPQYLGKAAGGAMAGWDQTNWDDQNMQTPKYVVGRILSNYTPSIDGLGAAMEEIQQAYPGAEFDGKDKIIIPGLGTIDVLVNAGGDNMSWAWQDQTNGPQDSPLAQSITQGATSPASSLLGGLDPSLFNDPAWRQLLESLGISLNGL